MRFNCHLLFKGALSLLFLLPLIFLHTLSFGQEVSGYIPQQSPVVCPNGEYSYYAYPSGTIPGTNNECYLLDSFSWSVTGGTIVYTNDWDYVVVIWNTSSYQSISLTTTYRVPFLPGDILCVDAGTTIDDTQTSYPTEVVLTISGSSNSSVYCTTSN